MSDNPERTVDQLEEPANHLVIATDLLQELVCNLGTDGALDHEQFDRAFYLALTVKRDAAALRRCTNRWRRCWVPVYSVPQPEKLRWRQGGDKICRHRLTDLLSV